MSVRKKVRRRACGCKWAIVMVVVSGWELANETRNCQCPIPVREWQDLCHFLFISNSSLFPHSATKQFYIYVELLSSSSYLLEIRGFKILKTPLTER